MRSWRLSAFILSLIIALFAAACTGQPSEQVAQVLPTLAQLPTETDTPIPSDTPVPTNTPSATPTPLPTETPLPTDTPAPTETPLPSATPTFTPSLTFTPSPSPTVTPSLTNTPIPSPTDTPSITPLPTLTPTTTPSRTPIPTRTRVPSATPLPTLTPTVVPTVTPLAPVIFSFGASAQNALPNSQITLLFNAQADGARIEVLNAAGAIAQTFPVLPAGSITVLVPDNLGRVIGYRFVATRAGVEQSQVIAINIICPVTWFFGDQFAPAGVPCPTVPGATGDGRWQPFQSGFMIYINANGLNAVIGAQNNPPRYIVYPNNWDGTTLNETAPPSGLFIPQQMFNAIYYTTNAPIGSWNGAIGWGLTDIDPSPRTIQWEGVPSFSSPGGFYIDIPGGGVYRFSGGTSGTWARVR
jgi:hypothetical protein